jgi:hypothetical protein
MATDLVVEVEAAVARRRHGASLPGERERNADAAVDVDVDVDVNLARSPGDFHPDGWWNEGKEGGRTANAR